MKKVIKFIFGALIMGTSLVHAMQGSKRMNWCSVMVYEKLEEPVYATVKVGHYKTGKSIDWGFVTVKKKLDKAFYRAIRVGFEEGSDEKEKENHVRKSLQAIFGKSEITVEGTSEAILSSKQSERFEEYA